MARIRSVSPGLRHSETAAQWDREARYAWVLLWGYLDDYGRGLDNARIIAADCFPLDDDVTPQLMEHWLDLYEAGGSICRYEFEGKRYLHVLNWSDHQKPQHPSKARITPCPKHEAGAHKQWKATRAAEQTRVSGNPHEGLVKPSPTSRGGGEVSVEVSEEERGGSVLRRPRAPPLSESLRRPRQQPESRQLRQLQRRPRGEQGPPAAHPRRPEPALRRPRHQLRARLHRMRSRPKGGRVRMTPHYADESVTLHHGDCLDVMAAIPDNSVDAVVTDPPYGLGFMGKAWDDLPPGLPWAQECLRVLKPGGHLLAFGGTRTWHRLACAVEDDE